MNATRTKHAKEHLTKPAIQPLYELFLTELAAMKDAEHQLTLAIPLLVKVAKSADLKELLEIHLKETRGHLETVQSVAESLGEELTKRSCKAMTAMIKEGVIEVVKNVTSRVSDTALIAAAQKIEHYEIASYGTLCAWGRRMGLSHEVALLTSILDQEKLADILLTGVAKGTTPLKELVEQASLRMAGADE